MFRRRHGSWRAPAAMARSSPWCDEHRQRLCAGCRIDAGVPRLLENEPLKGGDQEARHGVVVEAVRKLAAGSGLPDHVGQHRARRVNALSFIVQVSVGSK
jgi:hypothetical protein